jgi:hypothetical protein
MGCGFKYGFVTKFIRKELNTMTDEISTEEFLEGQTPVNLTQYVPNVKNFEELNELLLAIGAVVVLTDEKTLEDVGHNPAYWRVFTPPEVEA